MNEDDRKRVLEAPVRERVRQFTTSRSSGKSRITANGEAIGLSAVLSDRAMA